MTLSHPAVKPLDPLRKILRKSINTLQKISHRSSSDKRSFVSLCSLLAKSSVAIATHPQQIKIPRGQRLNESFLFFVRTLAPGFHLLFIPIAFRFHQFFTELFLQRDKRRDEAVANQQEQFIDAVFIINMCGCVAFFEHRKPNGGIVYKPELITKLQDFSGRSCFCALRTVYA